MAHEPAATALGKIGPMQTLEIAYYALLVLSALVITWFSVFVVYRLFRGQR